MMMDDDEKPPVQQNTLAFHSWRLCGSLWTNNQHHGSVETHTTFTLYYDRTYNELQLAHGHDSRSHSTSSNWSKLTLLFFIKNTVILFFFLTAYNDYYMRTHWYVVTKLYYRVESNHTSDSGGTFWICSFFPQVWSKKKKKVIKKNPEQDAHLHIVFFLELSKIMYILSQKKIHINTQAWPLENNLQLWALWSN